MGAGVILLTGLLFLSGVLWLAWPIVNAFRPGKTAGSLALVSMVFLVLGLIVYVGLRAFGVSRPPAQPQWTLIVLGPGMSFLGFAITSAMSLSFDRSMPLWAKAFCTLNVLSMMTLLVLTIYADWLMRFYGWSAISKLADSSLGSVILWIALALFLGFVLRSKVAERAMDEQ